MSATTERITRAVMEKALNHIAVEFDEDTDDVLLTWRPSAWEQIAAAVAEAMGGEVEA